MISLDKALYKATGIMTKSQIKRTCQDIGKDLSKIADEREVLNNSDVRECLFKYIGKRTKNKFYSAESKQEIINVLQENYGYTQQQAESAVKNIAAAVLPKGKGKQTVLALNINEMQHGSAINISTHELEHWLYNQTNFYPKISRFIRKLTPKKIVEKQVNKYGVVINENVMGFQIELRKLLGFAGEDAWQLYPFSCKNKTVADVVLQSSHSSNKQELQSKILEILNSKILGKNPSGQKYDTKTNLKILVSLKYALQDESRAYKVGGEAQRYWVDNRRFSNSEFVSELYDEAIPVIDKLISSEKKKYFLDLLHIAK